MSVNFEEIAQQFVFATLNGSIAGVDIYDDVPYTPDGKPNVQFPYVTIGEGDAEQWDNDSDIGMQVFVDLHIWSRKAGMREAKQIIGNIRALLHRQTELTADYKIVDCLCLSSSTTLDPDGETRHGISSYRLTIQDNS